MNTMKIADMMLEIVEYKNKRVLTTEQVAQAYECDKQQVMQNYNNNKDRFEEGKHYFRLEGEELKAFKNYFENIEVVGIGKRAPFAYLWTRQGASRHCKMLGTDKAWDMFDCLEENYFNPPKQIEPMNRWDAIIQMATAQKEHEKRMTQIEERVLEVESKQVTIDKHYYTISGYANLMHFKGLTRPIAAKMGKKASRLSAEMEYLVGEEYDAKYGKVNTYHKDILKIVFRG